MLILIFIWKYIIDEKIFVEYIIVYYYLYDNIFRKDKCNVLVIFCKGYNFLLVI